MSSAYTSYYLDGVFRRKKTFPWRDVCSTCGTLRLCTLCVCVCNFAWNDWFTLIYFRMLKNCKNIHFFLIMLYIHKMMTMVLQFYVQKHTYSYIRYTVKFLSDGNHLEGKYHIRALILMSIWFYMQIAFIRQKSLDRNYKF